MMGSVPSATSHQPAGTALALWHSRPKPRCTACVQLGCCSTGPWLSSLRTLTSVRQGMRCLAYMVVALLAVLVLLSSLILDYVSRGGENKSSGGGIVTLAHWARSNTDNSAAASLLADAVGDKGGRGLNAGRPPMVPQAAKGRLQPVWLATFPNSGTSYTLNMLAEATRTTFASVYATECKDVDPANLCDRDTDLGYMLRAQYPRPDSMLLVKTHCGGYGYKSHGYDCPSMTLEDTQKNRAKFVHCCASGMGEDHFQGRPAAIVHLFRNPVDNLMSRFHHQRNNGQVSAPKTRTGFQGYLGRGNVVLKQFLKSYTGWHCQVLRMAERLRVPILSYDYDDYHLRFEATVAELFSFLHTKLDPKAGKLLEFKKSQLDYKSWYTQEQLQIIAEKAAIYDAWVSGREEKTLDAVWKYCT